MTKLKLATASARVTVTLEIDTGGGAWGNDCTVDQIYKQALDGVRNRVDALIHKERGIRVIGEMRVAIITFPVDKDGTP